ncbi:MAG: M1 family aminopeptidase [candidate division KSB1 bacterium]|nr:M1 family aminopeptidase [candidate division KSB1 bacterium]
MKFLRVLYIGWVVVSAASADGLHPEKPTQNSPSLFLSEPLSNPVNVLHYDVHLAIFPEQQSISARVELELKRTDDNSENFTLDLLELHVDSVHLNGQPAPFEQTSEHVIIPFSGETEFKTTVFYHGHPGNDGSGGFFFKDSVIYSYGEGLNSNPPSMLRYWVPSNDIPSDKATLDMTVTVPRPFDLVANGELISITEYDSTRTFHWYEDDPIASYLIAFAAADYDTLKTTYTSLDGREIPLKFYILPGFAQAAQTDWQNIGDMMRIFETRFGLYPFEQYSMVQVPHRGAMEHQSMTTYSSSLITGDLRYEYVIAHELAHQWWGDWVTLSDWREIWLNEGFASYSEVIFIEDFYGQRSKNEHLQRQFTLYKRETLQRGHFSIYDPEFMWGGTVYNKGSWVLHRLRWHTGDERFFQILKTYACRYAFDNATVFGFRSVAEQIYGRSLDDFFSTWLWGAGYPQLRIAWDYQTSGNAYRTQIETDQLLFDVFPHPFPLEIEWTFPHRTLRDTLFFTHKQHIFERRFEARPVKLTIDPDQALPGEFDMISEPLPFGFEHELSGLAPIYPTPARLGQNVYVNYHVSSRKEPLPVEVSVYNVLGERIRTLVNRLHLSDVYKISWDGTAGDGALVSSGLYILKMQAGDRTLSRKFILVNP